MCSIGSLNPSCCCTVHILREISRAINDCCLAADRQVRQLFAVKTLEKFGHHGPRWDLAIAGVSATSAAAAGPDSTLPIPSRKARRCVVSTVV